MTVTTNPSTTALDLNRMVETFGLKGTQQFLARHAGEVVAYVSTHDGSRMVGTLKVGAYEPASEWHREGFTLNINGANGDFIATGVYAKAAVPGTYDWAALEDGAWIVVTD